MDEQRQRMTTCDDDEKFWAELADAMRDPSVPGDDLQAARDLHAKVWASAPKADATFRQRLEDQLVDRLQQQQHTGGAAARQLWSARVIRTRLMLRRRLTFAIAGAGLLFGAVAWPSFGQTVLKHVVPLELPLEQRDPTPMPETVHTLVATQANSIEDLERIAGFPLMVPKYLPSQCAKVRSMSYVDGAKAAYINYYCVSIEQRRLVGLYQPGALEGTVQQIQVDGNPGLYFVQPIPSDANSGAPEEGWEFRNLIFEANGLIVRLVTHPTGLPITEKTAPLSKEELIKIAESMHLHATGK